MKLNRIFKLLFILLCLVYGNLNGQDLEATMKMEFAKDDSLNICKVFVSSNDSVVKEVEVKLYVKRLFSLLPVGDATATDEDGMATFEFPKDIPADLNGKLLVIAKIEDDDNYANTEVSGEINWGTPRKANAELERSLAGSRANAPIYFIVVSNLIIFGIWGTLVYVVLQLFRIKRLGHSHKKTISKN